MSVTGRALEVYKAHLDGLVAHEIIDPETFYTDIFQDTIQTTEEAIKALKFYLEHKEQQMSKKVVSSNDRHYHFCKTCDSEVYKGDKFCKACGQALLWEEE